MTTTETRPAEPTSKREIIPSLIGTSVDRIDGAEKVSGKASYAADTRLPRMLFGAVLRSPHANARIRSIDTSRARRLPGVHAVITGEDTAGIKWGVFRPDLYPLAIGRVRYVGDEVAAVAAIDIETARRATELIDVEYEILPAVLSMDEALAEGAPLVHDDALGNIAHQVNFERGSVDEWFDKSDVVVEGTWETQRQWHAAIETIGCTADWAQDRVTLYVNTQTPFLARQRYAGALGLEMRNVRVVQTEVGGGFGGKSGDDNTSVICAILAKKAGRPVQVINTREEEFLATHPRPGMRYWVRLGFTSSGLVTAKDIRVLADNGAYTAKALAVMGAASVRHDALFKYRAVRANSRLVYTNLVPTGAFRGFGNPAADWAVGQSWDLAAEKLGIEAPELFLLNAVEAGSVSPHNHKINSCELKQCITKATEIFDWYGKRANPKPNRGIAMGCSIHVAGRRSFGDYDGSSAMVRLTDDGRATVITGEAEIGTGARTVFAQITASVLGLAMSDVTVTRPDTDVQSHVLGSFGSRTTYVAGNAVKRAAEDACKQLLEAAARQVDRSASELWIENGIVHGLAQSTDEPPIEVPVGAVVRAELYRHDGQSIVGLGNWDNPSEFPDHSLFGNESGAYTFVVEATEVEIDPETGAVTVIELVAVADCGTVLIPKLAQGQVEGALAQGLGFALTERFDWKDGAPTHPNFVDYKLPTAGMMPKITVAFADSYEPTGPFGAKGVGEIALDPVPAIISSAIADATGVRVRNMPITAEKVFWGIQEIAAEKTNGTEQTTAEQTMAEQTGDHR